MNMANSFIFPMLMLSRIHCFFLPNFLRTFILPKTFLEAQPS